jgi:hypothetical protein
MGAGMGASGGNGGGGVSPGRPSLGRSGASRIAGQPILFRQPSVCSCLLPGEGGGAPGGGPLPPARARPKAR